MTFWLFTFGVGMGGGKDTVQASVFPEVCGVTTERMELVGPDDASREISGADTALPELEGS